MGSPCLPLVNSPKAVMSSSIGRWWKRAINTALTLPYHRTIRYRRKRSGAFPSSSMKWSEGNDFISSHSAALPNHVPGPAFLRRISAPWRLAHPLCGRGLLYRSCIKLDGHSVFKSGASPDDIFKNKRRITIIWPITENVPCGRSNRNPSNIMNILDFLNVRMQCNIRGAESQCSAGDETQSLQCVHF